MSVTMRRCEECGLPFGADDGAKFTVCFPCWKAGREYKLTRSDEAHSATQRALADALAAIERGRVAIDDARLRRLISLCHPDKHGGSPEAGETTRWLLSVRDMMRATTR